MRTEFTLPRTDRDGACSGSTLLGVFTRLSALMVVALVVLQILEWEHYGEDTFDWPLRFLPPPGLFSDGQAGNRV